MNASTHTDDHTSRSGETVAGTFPTTDAANAAAHRLHEEGFHNIWHGRAAVQSTGVEDDLNGQPMISDTDEERLTLVDENDNVFAKIGRFFAGEDDESLAHALVHRGVGESDAQRIDATVAPNTSILTVDGANHPEYAAQIIRECGGDVVAGGVGALSTHAVLAPTAVVPSATVTTNEPTSFGDVKSSDLADRRDDGTAETVTGTTTYRDSASDLDGDALETRERLRQERRAMTDAQLIDIPTFREQVFIERLTMGEETRRP